ncbi:MAG: response regulator, partial [Bacteroidota bacterium]
VGLEATLSRDVFQAHHSRDVRVFTRGPGGGVSDPFTLAIDPVPLWGRWPFWAVALAVLGLCGLTAHRIRVLRLRRYELAELVEARTAELVAERERTQAQADALSAQADELRDAREARSRLFANVSHELRTPLTLVQGPLDEVLDEENGPLPTEARAALEVARYNVGRLTGLVDRLFRLTLLEAGRVELDPRPLDLSALVALVASALQPLADREEVSLTAAAAGALPVHADTEALGDAIGNVIRNGIQYTPPGGSVAVTVGPSPDAVEALVTVTDSGPGVPDEDRDRIFERFERGGGDRDGLGLGLALAREVLRAHGGDVSVEPAGRRGARFVLALPALRPDGVAAAAAEGTPIDLLEPALAPSENEVAWSGDDPHDAPLIYLVDDHDGVRSYVAHALQAAFRVDQAADADQALDDLRSRSASDLPDAVVLDVMMPGRDGLALVGDLRRDDTLADLPVLFLSARAGPQARREAIEAGGDDYLEKPFDAPELRARLHRLLERRREMQTRYRNETALGPLGVVRSEDERFLDGLRSAAADHLSDPTFRVEALAEEAALSKSQLTRKLRKALGTTPAGFLRTLRLDHAATLLRAGRRVGEAADEAGFRDVDHFSRLFADAYGARPSDYAASPPPPNAHPPSAGAAHQDTGSSGPGQPDPRQTMRPAPADDA